ncbi:hypothetical protein BDY24DRAFT_382248 [Mrakia frigida]|uniref:uncharacterized protein n=1 Tax=Mrakia frigida TaxID=29902 RepID=UPI003FCBF866
MSLLQQELQQEEEKMKEAKLEIIKRARARLSLDDFRTLYGSSELGRLLLGTAPAAQEATNEEMEPLEVVGWIEEAADGIEEGSVAAGESSIPPETVPARSASPLNVSNGSLVSSSSPPVPREALDASSVTVSSPVPLSLPVEPPPVPPLDPPQVPLNPLLLVPVPEFLPRRPSDPPPPIKFLNLIRVPSSIQLALPPTSLPTRSPSPPALRPSSSPIFRQEHRPSRLPLSSSAPTPSHPLVQTVVSRREEPVSQDVESSRIRSQSGSSSPSRKRLKRSPEEEEGMERSVLEDGEVDEIDSDSPSSAVSPRPSSPPKLAVELSSNPLPSSSSSIVPPSSFPVRSISPKRPPESTRGAEPEPRLSSLESTRSLSRR